MKLLVNIALTEYSFFSSSAKLMVNGFRQRRVFVVGKENSQLREKCDGMWACLSIYLCYISLLLV